MLRVSFSSMTTARAAVHVLEAYGHSATQVGRDVVTDCPPLLAVPAIQKRIGFAEIERLDLSGATDSIEATDVCWRRPRAPRTTSGGELTA